MHLVHSFRTVGCVVGGLALLSIASGCGGNRLPREAVQGDVTLDGSPLPAGVIRFVPTGPTKGPAALGVIKDGRFALTSANGPVPGKQIVEIDATLSDNPAADTTDIKTAWSKFAQNNASRPREIAIPKRYNRRSTLRVEVAVKAANSFEFNLASK